MVPGPCRARNKILRMRLRNSPSGLRRRWSASGSFRASWIPTLSKTAAMLCRSTPRPMLRRDATAFRRKYLAALTRQQNWNAGDALDFQKDLQIYEELIARSGAMRRRRKPFEAADHPFVDRCAFLLDSSFMEKARLAASRALTGIEELAAQIVATPGLPTTNSSRH